MAKPYPKPAPTPKKKRKPLKRTPLKRVAIKKKPRKVTGEYSLFMKIYVERKGICEITGLEIPFDVNSFMHILSKGAYPKFRLKKDNIMLVNKKIHSLYDNEGSERLLKKFPQAIVIYQKKELLKKEYYEKWITKS